MMKAIIRYVKKLLGIYDTGYEYWVYLRDIHIPQKFEMSWINEKKWKHKIKYYLRTGGFESKIILDKNFVLSDGYSSVKIARVKGIDKVPVYFEN